MVSYSTPQDKELPWAMPAKSFNLNIDGLKSIIADGGEGVVSLSTFENFAACFVKYTVTEGYTF